MRKKRNDFDAVGVERMTDAELSKKLGGYQRTESISISLGVLLVIAGCISMFIQHDPILVCALAFPGVALFLLVAKPAQTKKKALMQQQLGGFFRTELTKAFGPEPEPATLPIDRAYLKAAKLSSTKRKQKNCTCFLRTTLPGCLCQKQQPAQESRLRTPRSNDCLKTDTTRAMTSILPLPIKKHSTGSTRNGFSGLRKWDDCTQAGSPKHRSLQRRRSPSLLLSRRPEAQSSGLNTCTV